MKRIWTSLTIFILIVGIFSVGIADSNFDWAPNIAANYVFWSNQFGVPNFDDEASYSEENANKEKILYVDDLAIIYNNTTLETQWIALFFMSSNVGEDDSIYQTIRALALFAAIEYGRPQEWSKEETDSVLTEMWDIYTKLIISMEESAADLLEGAFVQFYESNAGRYYLSISDDFGILITVR